MVYQQLMSIKALSQLYLTIACTDEMQLPSKVVISINNMISSWCDLINWLFLLIILISYLDQSLQSIIWSVITNNYLDQLSWSDVIIVAIDSLDHSHNLCLDCVIVLLIFLIICAMVVAIKFVTYHVLMIARLNQFMYSHPIELLAFLRAACNLLDEKCNQHKHWMEDKDDGETVSWGYNNSDLQFFKGWSIWKA